MLITFWGDLARQLDVAVPNQRISVDFDITAIEYVKDGKSFYKNNIKGWRFALGAVDVQPNWVVSSAYQSQQPAPSQQVATIPGYQQATQQAAPAQQVAPPLQAAPQQVAAVAQQTALHVNGLPNPVMLNPGQAPF